MAGFNLVLREGVASGGVVSVNLVSADFKSTQDSVDFGSHEWRGVAIGVVVLARLGKR